MLKLAIMCRIGMSYEVKDKQEPSVAGLKRKYEERDMETTRKKCPTRCYLQETRKNS